MKQLFPHISIDTHESGRVILVVEDYELFDFIEDYLNEEIEIPYEYITSSERVGGEVITIYFPLSTRITEVESGLLKLSAQEIERIYLLNNKPN